MKTFDITTDKKKNRAFIRLSMLIAGIIIAISSLALIDTQRSENEDSTDRVMGTFKVIATDFSIQAASRVVVSSLWPF